MKRILLQVTLCLLLGANVHAQSDTQQDAALRTLMQQQAEAWNANDAAAWAAPFSEDAAFINVRGDAVNGRPAIEALHRMIFSSFYKGSHASLSVENIRHVSPSVAVIDTTYEVTRFSKLPPGIAATEEGILRARMRYIAVQEKDEWRIVAAQNTAISPKPLAPHAP